MHLTSMTDAFLQVFLPISLGLLATAITLTVQDVKRGDNK